MRLLPAVGALALTVAVPATAAPNYGVPDVRRHVTGTAQVHLLANDRAVYRVDVAASVVHAEATNPYSWVELYVARCAKGTCTPPVRYFAPLAAGQYDVKDLAKWSVRISAFGKPFTVTWTGAGPEGDADTTPAASPQAVDLSTPWTATAAVTILGRTCPAKATAARHTTVYPTGFSKPFGFVPIPPKVPVGQPAAAKACRASAA